MWPDQLLYVEVYITPWPDMIDGLCLNHDQACLDIHSLDSRKLLNISMEE